MHDPMTALSGPARMCVVPTILKKINNNKTCELIFKKLITCFENFGIKTSFL